MTKTTIKALVLRGIGDLRYEDAPFPQLKAGEALLRVKAAGICGSDIPRVFEKGTYHFPTIIGHEFAGEIVEAENKSIIGKRACVFPLLPCKNCEACKTLNYAQCENYDYYGSRRDGAMAEYIAVKTENLVFIPESVTFEEAAMAEPAAVSLHAFKKCEITNSVLIYGIGAIGLIFAQFARAAGIKNIILAGRTDEKVAFAKKLGFSLAVNATNTDLKEFVQEITSGKGAKICVEGTGTSETLAGCIENAANFGKIICLGNPLREMALSQNVYWKILRKELSLEGVWNSNFNDKANDWRDALKAIEDGKINLKPLITHKFLLSDYQEAFNLMKNKTEFYCKVMFLF